MCYKKYMTMKTIQHQIDKDTIWEETGKIEVLNFPPAPGTFAYIQRIYREYKRGIFGWKEVSGEPIYFHQLSNELKALAIVMGNAQNALSDCLPKDKFKEYKEEKTSSKRKTQRV